MENFNKSKDIIDNSSDKEHYEIVKNKIHQHKLRSKIIHSVCCVIMVTLFAFAYNFCIAVKNLGEKYLFKYRQTISGIASRIYSNEQDINAIYDHLSPDEVTTTYITVGEGQDFEDLKLALDSISDNGYYNRYVLDVFPGDYDYSNDENVPYLGFKNYVRIVGRSKGSCRIINKKSTTTYNHLYSGIDANYYQEAIMEASIENFTIITQGCKSPVHIDTNYQYFARGGKITIDNCNLIDMNHKDMNGISGDIAGGVNVGLRSGQSVIVKNCNSNGIIYAHNTQNQNDKLGCYFEIYNSRFKKTTIGDLCSNSPDKAYIHGCKLDYMCINIYPLGTDTGKYNWSIDLDSNDIGQIYGFHNSHSDNPYYLWDNYFNGKIAVSDSSIHDFCYNSSNAMIERGSFVKITDYFGGDNSVFGTGVEEIVSGEFYGVALEDIAPNDLGIIQFSGIIDISVSFAVNVGDKLSYSNGSFEINTNGTLEVLENNQNKTTIKAKIL